MERGISHSSDDVRTLCTKQLLGMCKAAGSHIRPHVVRLVPALLETLSVVEDPMLNYLQMNAENAGVAQSSLEAARVNAMRSSDATGAIDTCLRVMDAPQLEEVLPSLVQLLKGGVGLPTRAGTARFLVQLAQQHPLLLVPHASRLLRSLLHASLHERSEVARNAYAAAAAQMARGASSETLSKLVAELSSRYTSDEGGVEDAMRVAVGELTRELLRVASDAMNRVRAEWLPLAFVGKHEPRSQRCVSPRSPRASPLSISRLHLAPRLTHLIASCRRVAEKWPTRRRMPSAPSAASLLPCGSRRTMRPASRRRSSGCTCPRCCPFYAASRRDRRGRCAAPPRTRAARSNGAACICCRDIATTRLLPLSPDRYGLLEINESVPKSMIKAEQASEMGLLAARLVEKRWRDKEYGEQAKQIEALAKAHGHAPKEEEKEEEPLKAGAKRVLAEQPGEGEGPDSADM